MGISIAQLNMLSVHFGFDINEARKLIGLPVTTKSMCNKTKESTPKKTTSTTQNKRGRSGFNLYCADSKTRIEASLKAQKGVSKLARGELVSEMSKRWKQLPESTREMWNISAMTAS